MRTITGGERSRLAQSRLTVHVRAFIHNAALSYVELTNLSGIDWLDSVSWGADLDSPTVTATLTLRREHNGVSLAPLVAASSANSGGALLAVGRRLYFETAVTDVGVAPVAGDWKRVFEGFVDEVEWGAGGEVSLSCRGLEAKLLDTFIETPTTYPKPSRPTLAQILEDLITDWVTTSPPTLVTVGSPSFNPAEYEQQTGSLMEAMRALTRQIGWDVRYGWNGNTPELRLYQPDRAKATVDATIGPTEYLDVSTLSTAIADIRNRVRILYTNATTGALEAVLVERTASVTAYGRRFMQVDETATQNLGSSAQATTMANAILDDLSQPNATHAIEMLYWWPAELGDRYTFTANGVHYDSNQTYSVVGWRHELRNGSGRTRLTTRGQPAGAYQVWVRLEKDGQKVPAYTTCLIELVSSTATTVTVAVVGDSPLGTPKVRLTAMVGTSIVSGPALGSLQASGTQWTFARPASIANEWSIEAEAVMPGAVTDPDIFTIPAQGQDILRLRLSMTLAAVTPTQMTVRCTLDDSLPLGTNAYTITPTYTGPIAGTPQTGQLVSAGGYVDFHVDLPAVGQPSGRFTARATANAGTRVPDADAIDVYPRDRGTLSPDAATVALGTAVATTSGGVSQVQVPFSWPTASTAVRAEVWVEEHTTDPVLQAVDGVGFLVPNTRMTRGSATSSFTVPVMQPGDWVLISVVPYDELGRKGTVTSLKVQTPSVASTLPSAPTAVANVGGSSTETSLAFNVTLPTWPPNQPTHLRAYINGGQWGDDIAVTAASGGVQNVVVSGLQAGTTYTVAFRTVNANGESAGSSSAAGSTLQSTISTPTLTANTQYEDLLNASLLVFTVTPGTPLSPDGALFEVEYRINAGAWTRDPSGDTYGDSGYIVVARTGSAQTVDLRVRGVKAGYISSALSNVITYTVPAL